MLHDFILGYSINHPMVSPSSHPTYNSLDDVPGRPLYAEGLYGLNDGVEVGGPVLALPQGPRVRLQVQHALKPLGLKTAHPFRGLKGPPHEIWYYRDRSTRFARS